MQDLFRTLITVISLATFIGIVFWALSGRRKQDFREAASLPLNEPDDRPRSPSSNTTVGAPR